MLNDGRESNYRTDFIGIQVEHRFPKALVEQYDSERGVKYCVKSHCRGILGENKEIYIIITNRDLYDRARNV